MVVEKFIPIVVKSGNTISGRWTKMNYRNRVFRDIRWFFPNAEKPKRVDKVCVKVKMTRVLKKGDKKFDLDNFFWGLKPHVDWLVQNGWLYNDSPKWIEREVCQERATDIGMSDKAFGLIISLEYPSECFDCKEENMVNNVMKIKLKNQVILGEET